MELKETEDIKEGNVLGSLKNDDIMSRCVYPFNRIVVNPHGFVVACTADFHKKLELELEFLIILIFYQLIKMEFTLKVL